VRKEFELLSKEMKVWSKGIERGGEGRGGPIGIIGFQNLTMYLN
jgi:hypothetical protein